MYISQRPSPLFRAQVQGDVAIEGLHIFWRKLTQDGFVGWGADCAWVPPQTGHATKPWLATRLGNRATPWLDMVVSRCRGIGPSSGIPSSGLCVCWLPIFVAIQLQTSASPRARLTTPIYGNPSRRLAISQRAACIRSSRCCATKAGSRDCPPPPARLIGKTHIYTYTHIYIYVYIATTRYYTHTHIYIYI